jgi:hypothetical protein
VPEKGFKVSRREFARRAALASAAGTLGPMGSLFGAQTPAASGVSEVPQDFPKLSQQSQTEAEARFNAILLEYPSRFSDAEKKDLRRICYTIQAPLDHLRSYPVENNDSPALYLRPIVERERRLTSPPKSASHAPKL